MGTIAGGAPDVEDGMRILAWVAAAAATAALPAMAGADGTTPPLPAPAAYATANHGLTLRTPPRSFHCPLPDGWVGADHGTVLFLVAPARCRGAGFASSARGFDGDVPRIEIYYGYAIEPEDAGAPAPCRRAGQARLLGAARPLCAERRPGRVTLTTAARYAADAPSEARFTLVTTRGRLRRDLAAFRALLASTRTCTATWQDEKGRATSAGTGAPCPAGASWF